MEPFTYLIMTIASVLLVVLAVEYICGGILNRVGFNYSLYGYRFCLIALIIMLIASSLVIKQPTNAITDILHFLLLDIVAIAGTVFCSLVVLIWILFQKNHKAH